MPTPTPENGATGLLGPFLGHRGMRPHARVQRAGAAGPGGRPICLSVLSVQLAKPLGCSCIPKGKALQLTRVLLPGIVGAP